ncbi:hypothetical protein CEUSTIGMA_g1960.t1 [Chlamydomonas eustigma]|uniref:Uncharacterized protein n=1 Tax=Chlamydomonas eustigma TaxID=1157962 RepID=A0A250WUM3_9CHLO|nr:hypothetical protein CEUSTIGMA_g1960.t1 [Chlamydomonas eustigma]|eukprot:GAX74511.1 hypothetical protein CEUSTIGMA_g1960.t1 [Chlamydomonas eustigma]
MKAIHPNVHDPDDNGTSAYQPTRDLSGAQLSTLQLAMDTVMMCVTRRNPIENLCAATEGCVTSMSLWESSCVTISAILDLDHRTVQPHLQEVWHLLWLTAGAHEGCKSVQTMSTSESSHITIADATTNIPTHIIATPVLSSNRSPSMQSHLGHRNSPRSPPSPISHAAVSLVCKIVSAYRELRQLQYLLNSLNSSLLSIADELLKKEDVESAASPHRPSVHEHQSLAQRTAHMHTLCEGVLAVVRHQSFLKALEHAVRLLPSALRVDLTTAIPAAAATAALIQTPIAAMLKELLKKPSEWIPVHTDTGRGKAVTRALTGTSNLPHPDALVVELGGLSSQNKKRGTQAGRLKTAKAVPVVQPEAPAMIPKDELQDSCDQVPLNPKRPSSVSVGALVLMLKMYCASVRLHAQCAAMHPEVLPLVDQGVASESEAPHGNEPSVSEQPAVENSESLKDLARIRSGYFAPFQQWSSESHGGEGDLDPFLQVCETLQLSVLDPLRLNEFWGCSLWMVRELQEAFHTCMVQRLMMLSEQVQRLSAFCPKDEVIGTRSRVTQTRETAIADDKGVGSNCETAIADDKGVGSKCETAIADDKGVGSKTHDVPPGGGDGEGKDHKQEGTGVLRTALARKQSEGVQLTSFLLAPLLNASFTLYGDPPACPGRRSELRHFSHLPSHLPGTADTTLVAASAKREAMLHRALHSDLQIGSVVRYSEQIWISCMRTMPSWVRWASTYDLECILRIVVLQGSVEPFHWNAPTSEIMLLPEIQAAFPSAFTKLASEISNKVLHCLDEELFDPQFMKALTGTMRQASCDPPTMADSSSSSLHANVDNEHSRDTMLLLRFHALEDLIAKQMRTDYMSASSLRVNEHDGNNGTGLHLNRHALSNKGQESKALMQATSRLSGLKRKVQGPHHDSAASQDISRLRTLIHTLNTLPLACMDVTSLQDLFCSLMTLSVLCTALLPNVPALFSDEASKVEQLVSYESRQLVSYESRNEILQTLSCSLNLCSDLQHLLTQRQAAGIMCQQIPASCLKHLLEWGCASSYFLNCLVLPTSVASTQPSRMLESSRRRGTRMELREADERASSLGTSTDEMDQQKDNFLMDGVRNAVEAYAALVSSAAAVALGSLQQLKTKKRVSGCDPLRRNYKGDSLGSSPASGPEDSGAIALGDDPNPVASEIVHSASCLMSDIEGMFVTRVDAKGKLQTVIRGEIDDKAEEDEEAEDRGAMQSSKEAQVNIEPTVGLVGAAADHVTTVTTLRHHPQNLTLLNCHQLTYLRLYSKCCILSALTSQISVAVKTAANVSKRVVRGRNKKEGIAADDLIQNACPQSVEGILENIGGRALSLISIVNGHMPQSSTLTLSLKRQSLGCLLAIQGHAATPVLSHEMASQDTEQVMSQSLDAQEEGATVTRAMNHVPESQDVDEEDEADDHDLALSTASLPLHPQAPQQTPLASMHPSLEVAKAMLLQQFGKPTPLTKSTTPQLLYSRFLRMEADSRLASRVCCFLATAKTLIPEPNNQQSHLSQLSSLLDLHLELLAELTPSEVHPVPQPGGAWSLLAADLLTDGHRRSIRMGILLSIRSLLLTSTRDQLLHLLRLMTVTITSDLQHSPWSTREALGVVTQGSRNGESRGRGAGCGWKLPHLLCLLLVLEELPGPAPAAALAMHSAQMVSALTLLIPMLKWPGLQLHVASDACTSACICLCLRCLESISGRDTSFRLGPARVIGMVGAVAGLFPTTIKSLTVSTLHHAVPSGGLNDIGGMNWCGVLSASASLLASLTRHRAAVLQRSIPVVIQALKGMLVQLLLGSGQFSSGYAEGTNRLIFSGSSTSHSISTSDIDQVLMRCCSEISRVYQGVSTMDKHKVSKYCLVMVSDYISVVDSKNSAGSMVDKRVLSKGNDYPKTCGNPMAEWLPFKAAATLRRGVHALMATLSPAELQHLHKVLGTSGKGSDGGAKREILSTLRAEHEKLFKFQGKI